MNWPALALIGWASAAGAAAGLLISQDRLHAADMEIARLLKVPPVSAAGFVDLDATVAFLSRHDPVPAGATRVTVHRGEVIALVPEGAAK